MKGRIHGNCGTRITTLLPVLGFGLMTLGIAHRGVWGGLTTADIYAGEDFDVQKPYSAAFNPNRQFLPVPTPPPLPTRGGIRI
jgi:hypothetical protein